MQAGSVLAHYEIVAEIGSGGMGQVYRARDTRLDRMVAVKVLPPESNQDEPALRRFLREARAASALNHPNICTIHDMGDHEDRPFIVMECLAGRTLQQLLASETLDFAAFVDLALQITTGLEAAHTAGIIHRDLKPANIYVTEGGLAKILDFGLAKLTHPTTQVGNHGDVTMAAKAEMTQTQPGIVAGTLFYMSPEQALGRDLDTRTDLFSLGVVFYEMATGELPFTGDTPAAVYDALLNREPPHANQLNSALPGALGLIIARMLEKDPQQRYGSVSELLTDLQGLQQPSTVSVGASGVTPLDSDSRLAQARSAHERFAWLEAFTMFREIDTENELSAEDLERLAHCASWVTRVDVILDALERAHALYNQANRLTDAARVATNLAEENFCKNALSVANGWLQRAEGLLKELPESVEHGHFARLKTVIAIEADKDLEAGLRYAAEVREIAERFDDPDLRTLAIQDRGRILVLRDDVSTGMALIDEAMAAATAGELTPLTVGLTYCNMITTCELLADYRRAGEWSDRATRWCQPYSKSTFPGLCSVHRAEVMRVRGDWAEAEKQAESAVESCDGYVAHAAAAAFYVLGEIKLRRGAQAEAESAFLAAHQRGREPLPGLALLRMAQGRIEAARSLIDRALTSGSSLALEHLRLLPAGVEIALAAGDMVEARSRAQELVKLAESYESSVFTARAAHSVGSVDLAEGQYEDALTNLRRACTLWNQADMPHDEARSRTLMATAYGKLGDSAHAELEVMTARSIFTRLGAKADLAIIDTLT